MKLYRIKRISDGKFFHTGSNRINNLRTSGTGSTWLDAPQFSHAGGVLFKQEETIKRHLHNLCCKWKDVEGERWWKDRVKQDGEPDWSVLKDYEVQVITVIDYGQKNQSAVDFMGIKELA